MKLGDMSTFWVIPLCLVLLMAEENLKGVYFLLIRTLAFLLGANVSRSDSNGKSPIYWAEQFGHSSIVKLLREKTRPRQELVYMGHRLGRGQGSGEGEAKRKGWKRSKQKDVISNQEIICTYQKTSFIVQTSGHM